MNDRTIVRRVTYRVRYQENNDASNQTDGLPSILTRSDPVLLAEGERTEEYAGSGLEADIVLGQISTRLTFIPGELRQSSTATVTTKM